MPTVDVAAGVRLFVQDLGAGPAVVLIAGFGLDHRVWDAQVRRLAGVRRVVCIDQRGHGRSDKPLGGYDVSLLAHDTEVVLDALAIDAADVVGWSFGGQVALRLAALAPERVRSLVLVASNGVRASRSDSFPFGRTADELEPGLIAAEKAGRIRARRAAIVSAFASEPDCEIVDWLLRISLEMPSWAAVACLHSMLRADSVHALEALQMPVLQLVGTADPALSLRGARWVNAQLARAELVELEGCGHYPHLEAPVAFDEALLRFLSVD